MNTGSLSLISIIIALIIIGLAIFMVFTKKKMNREPNYKTFFVIGLIWLPTGIATKNYGLLGMGLAFSIMGLVNKEKWQEEKVEADLTLSKKIMMVGLTVLLVVGMISYYILKG